jgi:hypothetical protein
MNGQITLSRDPYIRANITRSRKEDIVPRYKKITIVLDILQNKYSHKICPKKIWQAAPHAQIHVPHVQEAATQDCFWQSCASCAILRASCANGRINSAFDHWSSELEIQGILNNLDK